MSAIREDNENHTFRYPLSERPTWTFAINSSLCEESENDTFRFPWSNKSCLDFLRPYQKLKRCFDLDGQKSPIQLRYLPVSCQVESLLNAGYMGFAGAARPVR